MPRIPVYTASGNLQGGPPSPDASPLAFNTAAGVGVLAQGMGNVGDALEKVADKKITDTATTWTLDRTAKDSDEWERWLQDEKQKLNPNIASEFKAFTDVRIKENAKDAPNRVAERIYSQRSSQIRSAKMPSAIAQGAAAMSEIAVMTGRQSVNSMVNNTLQTNARDPASAMVELESSWQAHNEWITSTFGTAAPLLASKLRAEATENVAIGVASVNPEFSRRIINESKDLDQTVKRVKLNQIDALNVNKNKMAKMGFQQAQENILVTGAKNLEGIQMPDTAAFKAIYGDDYEVAEAGYALKYKAVNDAAAFYAKNKDKNYLFQQQELQKLGTSSIVGQDAVGIVDNRVNAAEHQQRTDLGAWMQQNNPEVIAMLQASDAAFEQDEKAIFHDSAMSLMLKYQGYPPDGVSESEAARYFYLGTAESKVLSNAEAKSWVTKFNSSATTPQQKVELLDQFSFAYANHRDQAWRDLERVPGEKVAMELQVATLINSKTIRADVLGAIADPKVTAELAKPERAADFKKYIYKNNLIESFKQAKIGNHFQGSAEALAVDSMITSYAQSLTMSEKLSTSAASDKAIERIMGANIFTRSVNGQSMIIPVRDDDNSIDRTGDDADNIRNSLGIVIRNFPADKVDWARMNMPQALSETGKKNLISSQGFYRTEASGQEVTVYLANADGPPVQLRTKDNKPFTYSFNQMLQLANKRFEMMKTRNPLEDPALYPIQVEDVKSLLEWLGKYSEPMMRNVP